MYEDEWLVSHFNTLTLNRLDQFSHGMRNGNITTSSGTISQSPTPVSHFIITNKSIMSPYRSVVFEEKIF